MTQPASHTRADDLSRLITHVDRRVGDRWFRSAFDNVRDVIVDLIRASGARRVLEIGGGRSPQLTPDEAGALGIDYWVNDVSDSELALAPAGLGTLCFDISGELPADIEPFDLVYSRSLFEHVPDTDRALENSYALLAPGGVMFHFFPTLYAPPFVANRVLPDWLSDRLVHSLTEADYAKFPARYHRCTSTRRQLRRLHRIGFREGVVLAFYGHDYFARIPLLRSIDDRISRLGQRLDWRPLSTYAFLLARR